ncbi:PqqD family peptide modification chaperone [Deinococcus sp.]|uniref:PqqD family peptide modification chaperone n=1 Tax=Deinococcus sp. TaxID=47478 RepID=UPI003CC64764
MYARSPDALVTDLGDELVILNAQSGEMYNLNASGRAAWQALPTSLDGVAAALVALGAAPEAAQADARAWLTQLEAEGLVQSQ